MVVEGWYSDPLDSARLRYWDGAEWTEHTHDRPPDEPPPEDAESGESVASQTPAPIPQPPPPMMFAPPAPIPQPPPPMMSGSPAPIPQPPPPMMFAPPAPIPQPPPPADVHRPPAPQRPPFVPEPEPEPGLGLPTAGPGHLNDIGQWLRRSFKVGLAKLVPCGLLVVAGLVPAVFFYAVVYLAVSEFSDDGGLQGTSVVMLILAVVVFLLWMVWAGVFTLAENHLLYQAHVGHRTSISASLQAGFQGVGRLVWAYLTLVAYLIMVVAVVAGVTVVFSLVSSTLGAVVLVMASVGALTLSVWLGVKLIFLHVAAAVAPPGRRPIVVSVETIDGYFWAVLGRLLLLALILSVAAAPPMLVVAAIFGTAGSSLVNDPGSGTAAALIGSIAVAGVLYLLVTLAIQVFSSSATVRLYVDLGGPAQAEPAAVPQP